MRRVCFFAHNWHYVPIYRPIRDELARRGIGSDVLVLADPDETYFQKLTAAQTHESVVGFRRGAMSTTLVRSFGAVPFVDVLVKAIVARAIVRGHLRATRASIFATSDDRALPYPLAALSAARSLAIPSALLPVETILSAYAHAEDKAAIIPAMSPLRRAMRWVVRRAYPQGIWNVNGREVHFYQPRYLVPLLLFRLVRLPRNPWFRGSHPTLARVFVNSPMQADENVRGGIDRARMSVTGFPAHDTASRLRAERTMGKQKFERQFNVSARKIFLVVGMHFRGTYTPSEFPALEAELRDVFALIRDTVPPDHLIVVKLHPNIAPDEWSGYIAQLGARPHIVVHTEWDAYRLIAIADSIFLFTSSVVIASLATDAPILAYKLRLASFDAFYGPYASVRRARTLPELSSALARSTWSDEDQKNRLRDRATFGQFDGQCSVRVVDALSGISEI
jgi:hypothetical protein